MVANLDTNSFRIPIVNVTGSKTFALTDANTVQDCENTAPITLTIPGNAAVPFPIGTQITIKRRSTFSILVSAAASVTFVNDQGVLNGVGIPINFEGVLYKLAVNTWQLMRSIPEDIFLPGNNARAITQDLNTNSARVATTAYVNTSNRPFFSASITVAQTGFQSGVSRKAIYNNVITDTASIYDTATGNFTIPTGLGGSYLVTGGFHLVADSTNMLLCVGSATVGDIIPGGILSFRNTEPNRNASAVTGSAVVLLTPGTVYSFQINHTNPLETTPTSSIANSPWNAISMFRLNT